jgi:membrane-bound serine protease (ClpP class)
MRIQRIAVLLLALLALWVHDARADNIVVRVDVTGVIGQGVQDFVQRGLLTAENSGARALLVTVDTPGGLLETTKNICTMWQNSSMPVIVFVHPNGATATSAGFFLLMCSDVAAMAPDTSTGSAHPVSGQGEQMDKTMSEKVTNFSVSYMKTLTERRGRNFEFAEKAIRKSESITAQDALSSNVIEIVAPDIKSVLEKAHGMKFKKGKNTVTVKTRGATVKRLRMNLRESFLHKIGHPNIAYILFIVGLYALIFEVTHPGTFISGVIGVICLVTAFVAFSVLPVNYLGIMLIVGGVALFIAEIFIVSHGLLSIGGLALFVIGSLFMYNSGEAVMRIDPWLIAGVTGVTFVFIVIALAYVIKSLRSKVSTGGEGMIGLRGKTRTPLAPEGTVFVHGELWNARSQDGAVIEQNASVEVVALEGMELIVKPINQGGIPNG